MLTPAIVTDCEPQITYDEGGNVIQMSHRPVNNPYVNQNKLYILVPEEDERGTWKPSYFLIGSRKSNSDEDYAYNGIINLLDDERFLGTYLKYWNRSFLAYSKKEENDNIFWLTNACGKPSNLPDDWAGGVTCISDEKTSVGMDRTDDIKKGIYQVLKLGSEGKRVPSLYSYKVGIVSNIHPVRHFGVYLKPIKDLIWTISEENDVRYVRDLPPEHPLYNLFDGIITFTKIYSKDKWVSELIKIIE